MSSSNTEIMRFTDPNSKVAGSLLGGFYSYKTMNFTKQQFKDIQKLFEFHDESTPIQEAGMKKAVMERASHEGLRLVGLLAKHCEPGTDLSKFLVSLMIEADIDMGELYEWAYDEQDDD